MKIRNIRKTKKAVSAIVGAMLLISIAAAALASVHLYLSQSTSKEISESEAEFDIMITEWERKYDINDDDDTSDDDVWINFVEEENGGGDGTGDSNPPTGPTANDDIAFIDPMNDNHIVDSTINMDNINLLKWG